MEQMEQIIEEYCNDILKNGIKQGEPDWVLAKLKKFGGTSMGYFTGAKYKSLIKMVMNRVGLTKDDITPYIVSFGSLFEELVKRVAEHDTKSKVYGEDIYVIHNDIIAYSPDGIAYIDTSLFDGPCKGKQICLLEFKCPFSRYPNGTVPEEYIAQQHMGLDVISMCKYSLYLEAVFRRCTFKELGHNSKYDHELNIFNKDRPQTVMTNLPLAWGIIGFSVSKDYDGIHKDLVDLIKRTADIGSISVNHMKKFIEMYAEKVVRPYYYDLIWTNENTESGNKSILKSQVLEFKNHIIPSHVAIGFLPYKLFRRDYHWVKPVPNFLEKHADEMQSVANLIEKANSINDNVKKSSMVNSYFDPYDTM